MRVSGYPSFYNTILCHVASMRTLATHVYNAYCPLSRYNLEINIQPSVASLIAMTHAPVDIMYVCFCSLVWRYEDIYLIL